MQEVSQVSLCVSVCMGYRFYFQNAGHTVG